MDIHDVTFKSMFSSFQEYWMDQCPLEYMAPTLFICAQTNNKTNSFACVRREGCDGAR